MACPPHAGEKKPGRPSPPRLPQPNPARLPPSPRPTRHLFRPPQPPRHFPKNKSRRRTRGGKETCAAEFTRGVRRSRACGWGRGKVKGSRSPPAPSRHLLLLPRLLRLPRTFRFPSFNNARHRRSRAERSSSPSLPLAIHSLRRTGRGAALRLHRNCFQVSSFSVVASAIVLVKMACCFMFGKKAKQTVEGDEDLHSVKVFSYNDLRKATQDFSGANKIGDGGFGSVFRGMLKDGTLVAVKVLSATSRQGIREFLAELTAISDIKHENLVTLIGCCAEGSHRILVYNYLENNSLAQTLLGSRYSNIRFNWRARVKIAVGVARGLAFLHEEIRPPIIHRDIKASNILLDKDLTPKISDFGLARLLPPNATHVSTRVAGTLGYLAPEYAIRGQVTKKSDIYSYGVLLLEIVSGRCNTNTRLPSEDQFLLERTWVLYEEGRLEEIVDIDIGNDLDVEEACRFLKIGLLCTQDAMARRPNMTNVVRMLSGEKRINVDKITRPAMITDFADLKISNKEQRQGETRSPTTTPTTKSFTTTEPFSSSETPTQSST